MTVRLPSPALRLPRLSVFLLSLMLGACASQSGHRAPVEDRGAAAARPTAPAAPAADTPRPVPPGAENAGKPGYYSIKPGDTLIRVGLETGQNWRDIARWNGIDNPNLIEVGQVVRVVPPGVDPAAPATRGVSPARVDTRPLAGASATPAGAVATTAPGATPASGAAVVAANAASAPAASNAARDGDEDVNWAWPSAGSVLAGFDEPRTKGLVFGGKAGDPVQAAADGRVMYVGSAVRGLGNLVIIKHVGNYLTAYGHNQTLLVKEDQVVRRGQKIAEMGSSDAERVQLHFEIRRQGKPIDPARLLPAR